MGDFAIDFGITKDTIVLPFGDNGEEKRTVLKGEMAQVRFLRQLEEGDRLFLEAGSGADEFCIGALEQEAVVFRLATHAAKEIRIELGLEKKDTARMLAQVAQERPEAFMRFTPQDLPIARLRVFVREFLFYQRNIRGVVERRTAASARGRFLMERSDLSYPSVQKEALANDPVLSACRKKERERRGLMVAAVNALPVYKEVLSHIPGFGPTASALLIAEMGREERFRSLAHLKRVVGFAVFEGESSVSRRKKGVRLDYDPDLQLALWYATTFGVLMTKSEKNPWRELYDLRMAYEVSKDREVINHPSRRGFRRYNRDHLHRMALRFVGEKLLKAVWRSLRAYRRGETLPEVIEPTWQYPWLTPEIRTLSAKILVEKAKKKMEAARNGKEPEEGTTE